MLVRDYMKNDPVTAHTRDGLRQTFYRMRERGVRHMPVVDEREQLVGIISDRDLRRPGWVDAEENVAHYYILDNATKVQAAMTENPVSVTPDDSIARAVALFVKHRFGALPVIEAGSLVGILSNLDVLRAFHDQLS